jgi:hypothetical protein
MGQEPLARSLLLAPRPLPLNESLLCARAPVRKPRARVFVCRVEAQEPAEVSGRRLADVAVSGVELERRHPISRWQRVRTRWVLTTHARIHQVKTYFIGLPAKANGYGIHSIPAPDG